MSSSQTDISGIQRTVRILEEVGLKHYLKDDTVVVEGGVCHEKALTVEAFVKAVTDSEGLINPTTLNQGLLEGRRVLLAQAITWLCRQPGIKMVRRDLFRSEAIDELYEIIVGGTRVKVALMPK